MQNERISSIRNKAFYAKEFGHSIVLKKVPHQNQEYTVSVIDVWHKSTDWDKNHKILL